MKTKLTLLLLFIASMASAAETPQAPAAENARPEYDFVVAKDGSGDFTTVQEAVNAVPDLCGSYRTRILVKEGRYEEKLVIPQTKINLSLIGEGDAVITYGDYASKKNRFDREMGTAGSSSCYIFPVDFYAENITFENTAGNVGQAVACYVGGDRTVFKNCRFLGNQDTLYTHSTGRQYYTGCYIEGTVDFIFGKSTALFDDCTIHCKRAGGYITAPATPQGQRHGYVFTNCMLTADSAAVRCWYSRPWRDYGQTVFIRCDVGGHIRPEGWHNWRKPEREKTAFYAEYGCTGEGADTTKRVPWAKVLTSDEGYSLPEILGGDDNWDPTSLTGETRAVVYP